MKREPAAPFPAARIQDRAKRFAPGTAADDLSVTVSQGRMTGSPARKPGAHNAPVCALRR